jgi:tetratricopeptide (TPR) repeat protein
LVVKNGGGAPIPKILDFGIAKTTTPDDPGQSYASYIDPSGTPLNMAPEQARMTGRQADGTADVYSLGVLFVEMLTGKTPLRATHLKHLGQTAIMQEVLQQPPTTVSAVFRNMSAEEQARAAHLRETTPSKLLQCFKPETDAIVLKSTHRAPTKRYQRPTDFAEDIRRHLRGEPVEALRPWSLCYLAQKYPLLAVFAAVVLLIMVAALFLVARLYVNERTVAMTALREEEQLHQTMKIMGNVFQKISQETVEEIVNEVNGQVSIEMQQNPDAQFAIRRSLVGLFHQAGLYVPMDQMAQANLMACRARYSKPSLPLAEACGDLAEALHCLGRYSDAEPFAREGLTLRTNLSDLHSESAADAYDILGCILQDEGRWNEAGINFALAKAIRDEKFGPSSFEAGKSLSLFGSLFDNEGDSVAAFTNLMAALQIEVKHVTNATDPQLSATIYHLALVEMEQAKLDPAKKRFAEAFDMRTNLFGNAHPLIAEVLNGQAVLLRVKANTLSDLATAEELQLVALKMRVKFLGEENPIVAESIDNLANDQFYESKFAPAVTNYTLALNMRRITLGPDHPETCTSFYELVRAELRMSNPNEAERLCLEQVTMLRTIVNPNDQRLAAALAYQSVSLIALDDFSGAARCAEECLSIRKNSSDPSARDLWLQGSVENLLGAALFGQKEYQSSEQHLVAAYQTLDHYKNEVRTEGKARLIEVEQRLVLLYQTTHRSEVCAKYQAILADYKPPTIEEQVWVDSRPPLY